MSNPSRIDLIKKLAAKRNMTKSDKDLKAIKKKVKEVDYIVAIEPTEADVNDELLLLDGLGQAAKRRIRLS